jgi:Glycosyl transferase family 64 domain
MLWLSPISYHRKSRNNGDSTHDTSGIVSHHHTTNNDNSNLLHPSPTEVGPTRLQLDGGEKKVLRRKPMILVLGCIGVVHLVAVHRNLPRTMIIPRNGTGISPKDADRFLVSNATNHSSSPSKVIRGSPKQSTFSLTPLRPIDYEYYTIRMNAWRRPTQLVASVVHHASCPGVKKIQIVWCDSENEPPAELFDTSINPHSSKVYIERHEENTLNERFRILDSTTPTLGILSIDDDVLRPCSAIDSGFFKWTKSPHRMVGFDPRVHVETNNRTWAYTYLR